MLEEDITPRGDTPQPTILTTADLYGKSAKSVEDTGNDVSDEKSATDVSTGGKGVTPDVFVVDGSTAPVSTN